MGPIKYMEILIVVIDVIQRFSVSGWVAAMRRLLTQSGFVCKRALQK